MKAINYKGKGEHSVNQLELIIEQQAEELHLLKSGQKTLTLYSVAARLLKNYNCDTLQIEMDEETKSITVTKCTISDDYYADYDYKDLEELTP